MDQPDINFKVYKFLGPYMEALGFIFLGFVGCLMMFSVFIYWKTLLICYLRKDEKFNRGMFYSFVDLKKYYKKILFFTIIILTLNVLLCFTPHPKFTFSWGFTIFFTGYFLYCFNHYYLKDNFFDLFDDFIWIFSKIKSSFTKEGKIKQD